MRTDSAERTESWPLSVPYSDKQTEQTVTCRQEVVAMTPKIVSDNKYVLSWFGSTCGGRHALIVSMYVKCLYSCWKQAGDVGHREEIQQVWLKLMWEQEFGHRCTCHTATSPFTPSSPHPRHCLRALHPCHILYPPPQCRRPPGRKDLDQARI